MKKVFDKLSSFIRSGRLKKNYFHIDESGGIKDNSNTFVVGCTISDTPKMIREQIDYVEKYLFTKLFFRRHVEKFKKQGFHACENHFDIYNKYLEQIVSMNFRAYLIVLNKKSDYFKNLIAKYDARYIYDLLLSKLLADRLIKRSCDNNLFCFEQNLSNPTQVRMDRRKRELNILLRKIISQNNRKLKFKKNTKFSINLCSKEEKLLSVIDYINHVVLKYYEGVLGLGDMRPSIKENYELIEPKIGSIFDIANKRYFKIRNQEFDPLKNTSPL